MSLELLNYGNQWISMILLFFLTTCLAYPKMIIFLFYSEAQQRKGRGWEGKEEREEEEEEGEEKEEETGEEKKGRWWGWAGNAESAK